MAPNLAVIVTRQHTERLPREVEWVLYGLQIETVTECNICF